MFDRRSVVQQPSIFSGFAQDRTITGNSLVFWWERRVGCWVLESSEAVAEAFRQMVDWEATEKPRPFAQSPPRPHRQRLSVTSLMVRHTFFPTTNISPSTVIYVVSWLFSHMNVRGIFVFKILFDRFILVLKQIVDFVNYLRGWRFETPTAYAAASLAKRSAFSTTSSMGPTM
jgi:hypothetical protein